MPGSVPFSFFSKKERCIYRIREKCLYIQVLLEKQKQRLINLRAFGQAMAPKYPSRGYVVTTDVADPDNFLMILRALKDHPDEHIEIVISPRPVDLAAIPYGGAFGKLVGNVGVYREDTDQAFVEKLDDQDKKWFYLDVDFHNAAVRADTGKYMKVSWLRMVAYLDAHNVDRDQYTFYWDTKFKLSNTIEPGLHHAAHKPDFSFDFDDDLKSRFKESIRKAGEHCKLDDNTVHMRSEALRRAAAQHCEEYVSKKEAVLKIKPEHKARDLNDLLVKLRAGSLQADIFIGGPFTEALHIVEAVPVRRIVAMAGSINGSLNIFANQFNLMIDMASARKLLRMADAGRLDLTLLPTECVKSSLYSLSPADFDTYVAAHSPDTKALYDQWQNGKADPYNLFDLIAVMAASKPDLFTQKRVRLVDKDDEDNGETIRFAPLPDNATASDTPAIKMFWNESQEIGKDAGGKPKLAWDQDPHMARMQAVFLDELVKTFQ